ncbi:hypothetical protein RHMOL_Rhmol06G0124400 [Rhododendron molle]|uniref:Uncharacterized protein n=1 Tax=Rhododendron molle TaxID=49168 RepID=A0ACC0NBG6_RHOML|nr:hypothetical protein RHMOL_Rhmol06G0124400 [Rhododendron molle]
MIDAWLLGLGLAIQRLSKSVCSSVTQRLEAKGFQFAGRINSPRLGISRSEELRGYCGGVGNQLSNLAIWCEPKS